MRAYDIDITLRIKCVAHNRDEAVDTVVNRFDIGAYCDHTADGFQITKVKEVDR